MTHKVLLDTNVWLMLLYCMGIIPVRKAYCDCDKLMKVFMKLLNSQRYVLVKTKKLVKELIGVLGGRGITLQHDIGRLINLLKDVTVTEYSEVVVRCTKGSSYEDRHLIEPYVRCKVDIFITFDQDLCNILRNCIHNELRKEHGKVLCSCDEICQMI